MTRDQAPPPQAPDKDDNTRTEETRRVIEDYTKALREVLQKLRRRLFN